jgi:hypothetical protein
MNSPFIDDNTLEHIGFIENGHSRLVYRPNLEMKIRQGLKEVMEGDLLTSQQTAQLKHLSSPIRVECHRGAVKAVTDTTTNRMQRDNTKDSQITVKNSNGIVIHATGNNTRRTL